MPLISQVPERDPMSNRMRIAGVVEEILLLTPFKISLHLKPLLTPIIAANAAENKRANWFAPFKALSPYRYTFSESNIMRNNIGINALKKDCCFMRGVYFVNIIILELKTTNILF